MKQNANKGKGILAKTRTGVRPLEDISQPCVPLVYLVLQNFCQKVKTLQVYIHFGRGKELTRDEHLYIELIMGGRRSNDSLFRFFDKVLATSWTSF